MTSEGTAVTLSAAWTTSIDVPRTSGKLDVSRFGTRFRSNRATGKPSRLTAARPGTAYSVSLTGAIWKIENVPETSH